MNEIFKCVVPKIESANNARFIKIGSGKLSLTHVDFVKDEDSLMTGYIQSYIEVMPETHSGRQQKMNKLRGLLPE